MSGMSRRAWGRLVISLMITGAVAFVGALAWSAWRVYRLPVAQRTDAVGFGQFLLALVGAATAAIGAVGKRLAPSARRSTEAVEGQWTRAAGERRLLEPAPIPVRWRRSSLPIAGPVSAAVGAPGAPAR